MVAVCTLLLRNADARGGQQGKLPQLLKEMAYKQSWIATRSIYNTVNHGPVQVAYPLISLFLSSMFSLSPDYLASLIHGGGYCVTSGFNSGSAPSWKEEREKSVKLLRMGWLVIMSQLGIMVTQKEEFGVPLMISGSVFIYSYVSCFFLDQIYRKARHDPYRMTPIKAFVITSYAAGVVAYLSSLVFLVYPPYPAIALSAIIGISALVLSMLTFFEYFGGQQDGAVNGGSAASWKDEREKSVKILRMGWLVISSQLGIMVIQKEKFGVPLMICGSVFIYSYVSCFFLDLIYRKARQDPYRKTLIKAFVLTSYAAGIVAFLCSTVFLVYPPIAAIWLSAIIGLSASVLSVLTFRGRIGGQQDSEAREEEPGAVDAVEMV